MDTPGCLPGPATLDSSHSRPYGAVRAGPGRGASAPSPGRKTDPAARTLVLNARLPGDGNAPPSPHTRPTEPGTP